MHLTTFAVVVQPTLALALCLILGAAGGWPTSASAAGQNEEIVIHSMRPGENPWQVVRSRLRSLDLLPKVLELNGITDPTHLLPGTPIKLRPQWLHAMPLFTEVVHVAGEVDWRPSEQVEFRPLGVGERLRAGSQIRTQADGQCTLAFAQGTRTLVRPDSEVHLLELKGQSASHLLQLRLSVLRGAIENLVEKQRPGGRFEIKTPSGVATVRGTAFRVQANAALTQTAVDQGAVRLANEGGQRLVPAGFRAGVAKGAAPTEPAALLAPPDLGALPDRIERFPAVLELAAVAGMQAARGQWLLGGDPVSTVLEAANTRLVLTGQGVPDGQHILRVRLIDAEGYEGQAAEVPLRVHRRPDPPTYIQPAPSAVVSQAQPDLAWARGEPPQVRVQVSSRADMTEPAWDKTLPNSGEWQLPEVLEPGTWFWRLASVDAAGEPGPWGVTQKFFRQPQAPAGSQGLEEGATGGKSKVLRWSAVPGAQGYELSLRALKDPQAAPLLARTGPDARWTLPEDLAPGDYELRLRAVIDEGITGDWSTPQTLSVPRGWNPWIWVPLVVPLLFF